jgi:ferredoxin-thioredoxin reductase catalytic chain
MTKAPEGAQQASEKSLDTMRKFAQTYAQRSGTYFCSDLGTTAVVIEGLAKHKEDLGAPLCPCRFYEDKEAEVKSTYWNCPCVPMRERHECHCMLFLTEDNPFAGTKQEISIEEIRAATNKY